VYEDFGNLTCGGYPGLLGHLEDDIQTIAEWGADSLKVDGCYMDPHEMDRGYSKISQLLNQTGRQILFSCSATDYIRGAGLDVHYELYLRICNLWRLYDDIQDDWDSVIHIIDYWGDNQDSLVPAAGPGHWNDPDMILVGDFSYSVTEAKTHFAMWAMLAAPLLLSSDLRNLPDWAEQIILNKEIIAIDQDPLGMQARRVYVDNVWGPQVWYRLLVDGQAVALYNRGDWGAPLPITANWLDIGLNPVQECEIRDLYQHQDLGKFVGNFTASVPPHGVVILMFKCKEMPF